jgi:hypothetical protein
MGSASLKPHTLVGYPYEDKSTSHKKVNAWIQILWWRLIYNLWGLHSYMMLKHENDGGCLHSMSTLASVLRGPRDSRPLTLFFQWPHIVHPILSQACWSSMCEGSIEGLNCQRWILFSWPSGPSKILSCLDTFESWLPLSTCLIPTRLSPQLH